MASHTRHPRSRLWYVTVFFEPIEKMNDDGVVETAYIRYNNGALNYGHNELKRQAKRLSKMKYGLNYSQAKRVLYQKAKEVYDEMKAKEEANV